MHLTPEILRDHLSAALDKVAVYGNTSQRLRDIRIYEQGEACSPEYLYLLPEYDPGFAFNAIVATVPPKEPPLPPAETCTIFTPCEPGRLLNLVRECYLAYSEWYRKIYESIALGDSMESILEACYPVLKNPFFIDDSSYRTLARLKDYPADNFQDDEYIFMQKNGHHSSDYIYAMLNSEVALESSTIAPRPIIHRFGFLAHRTLYSTIKVDGEIVGFFSCLELETAFTDGIMDVFEALTELMSLALSRESYAPISRKKGLNNDLFLGILNGSIEDPALKETTFSQMRLTRGNYFVGYITTNVDTMQNPFLLPRITELLISNLASGCFSVADGSNIVLIVNHRPDSGYVGKMIQLTEFYLREFEVSIGLSLGFEDPRYLPVYYEQALAATRLGPLLGRDARTFRYGDVVGLHLVERFGDRDRQSAICHPAIFTLLRHDAESQVNLLPTLKTYIECMGDTKLAAKQLYLHRNTLYYRLKQIEDLTGLDLHDGTVLYHAMLSLQMLLLQGEFQIHPEAAANSARHDPDRT